MRPFPTAVVTVVVLASGCTAAEDGTVPAPTPAATAAPEDAPEVPTWGVRAPAPTARTEVAAAATSDRIVVTGGFVADGVTDVVEVLDLASGEWSAGPDLPVPLHHAMATSDGDEVIVAGGYLTRGFDRPSDRAFVLRGDGWVALPPMPGPRAAGGAVVVDGRLHVVAGVDDDGLAESLLVHDLGTGTWTSRPGPPTPREHLGVATSGGRIVVVGGRTGGIGSNLATVEAYDARSGTWETLADLPTARGGMAAAATAGGMVVVPGGEEAGGTFPEVEVLDLATGRWSAAPPLPTPRHGLGVVAVGEQVHVIAGGPEPGFTFSAAHEVLDLAPRDPATSGSPERPSRLP